MPAVLIIGPTVTQNSLFPFSGGQNHRQYLLQLHLQYNIRLLKTIVKTQLAEETKNEIGLICYTVYRVSVNICHCIGGG